MNYEQLIISKAKLAGRKQLTFEDIYPIIEHMRIRLNSYELYIRGDGKFCLADEPISDNQLVCILKRDLETAGVGGLVGRERDLVIRQTLCNWRKRLQGVGWDEIFDVKKSVRVRLESASVSQG